MSRLRGKGSSEPHWTPDVVRQRIKISNLLTRLDKCAQGKIRITSDSLKSIELLLAKALPNLNAVDVNIDGSATINVISDKPRTIIEWEADASRYLVASAGPTALIG